MWASLVFLAITFSYSLSTWVTKMLGLLGATYLAYLGFQIIKNRSNRVANDSGAIEAYLGIKAYLQGFLLHATNPKAFFGWLAIVSVGRVDEATGNILLIILLLCTLQAAVVFGAYAMVFSTNRVISLYQKYKVLVDLISGTILVGFALITLYHLGIDIVKMS